MNSPNFKDLTGQTFGRLIVIFQAGKDRYNYALWETKCSCGNKRIVNGRDLRAGDTTSCGCAKRERIIARSTTHGLTKGGRLPLGYVSWSGAKNRCLNPNNKSFRLYGGRGITMCKRWSDSFEAFIADMGNPPSRRHSLDRFPNQDGNYEPCNCRWATAKQQSDNQRTNRILEFQGKRQNVAQWALELGIRYGTLRQRLRRSWPIERALS